MSFRHDLQFRDDVARRIRLTEAAQTLLSDYSGRYSEPSPTLGSDDLRRIMTDMEAAYRGGWKPTLEMVDCLALHPAFPEDLLPSLIRSNEAFGLSESDVAYIFEQSVSGMRLSPEAFWVIYNNRDIIYGGEPREALMWALAGNPECPADMLTMIANRPMMDLDSAWTGYLALGRGNMPDSDGAQLADALVNHLLTSEIHDKFDLLVKEKVVTGLLEIAETPTELQQGWLTDVHVSRLLVATACS